MQFEFDSTASFWQEQIRSFLRTHQSRKQFETNSDERFPWELRKQAGREGLLRLDVSKRDGGLGLSHLTMGLLYQELGKISVNARELIGTGHGAMIARFGTAKQKSKYLEPLMKGNILVGVALTEPSCGSDLAATQTKAQSVDSGYLLNGTKEWISRIQEADVFIVFATTQSDKGVKGLTAFLVEMDDPNIERFDYHPMGLKGWSYGGFHLKNVFVPADRVLGEVGQGFEIFNLHFAAWRVLMALLCIGAAEDATCSAIEYAKERKVFGGSLARMQSVMHKVTENLTKLEAAQYLCYRALSQLDQRKSATKEVAMAKWYGTQVAYETIDAMIQIFGARGYCKEYGLEQRLRDIRGFLIADGSNDVLKSLIGREVFGKQVYNEMLAR